MNEGFTPAEAIEEAEQLEKMKKVEEEKSVEGFNRIEILDMLKNANSLFLYADKDQQEKIQQTAESLLNKFNEKGIKPLDQYKFYGPDEDPNLAAAMDKLRTVTSKQIKDKEHYMHSFIMDLIRSMEREEIKNK